MIELNGKKKSPLEANSSKMAAANVNVRSWDDLRKMSTSSFKNGGRERVICVIYLCVFSVCLVCIYVYMYVYILYRATTITNNSGMKDVSFLNFVMLPIKSFRAPQLMKVSQTDWLKIRGRVA
jgi:hypothetical protein